MNTIKFTVDSKLLRELGERLVGQPFIALAELIKNSYDADANLVELEFIESNPDFIIIQDNGCGMTFEEFRDFWMRIGSTHKQDLKRSKKYKRALTGSKGIGRLAAQFLAKKLEINSVSEKDTKKRLKAYISWVEAINTGELTEVKVRYEIEDGNFKKGTIIKLINLIHVWSEEDFQNLAKELWQLVPPFPGFMPETGAFKIDFKTQNEELVKMFKSQMKAHIRNYDTKIYGKNINGKIQAHIEYRETYNVEPLTIEYELPKTHSEDRLKNGKFEIRIFSLKGRQLYGISIEDLRNYMHEFGGVHIYDSNFRLPYYGSRESDWLGILQEHARRISISEILPESLQEDAGLTFLPSVSRILGIVNISTSQDPGLRISITRDRLLETQAYEDLRYMIRYALHWYANVEAKRQAEMTFRKREIIDSSSEKLENVREVLQKYKTKISDDAYPILKEEIDNAIDIADLRDEKRQEQISLLGAFATAGISSLAYHHEISKQLNIIDEIAEDIDELAHNHKELSKDLNEIKKELLVWSNRARNIQSLFDYYADADNLTVRMRINARNVINDVIKQVKRLGEGINIVNDIKEDLLLPDASLVEWGAIFQNVLINAFNALEKSKEKEIKIINRTEDNLMEILVQDSGCGVDLETSEELFQPFIRKIEIPPEKRALGYGGTGIGLTIVKLISERIGCRVSFIEPMKGYKTAFSLSWREKT